MDVCTVRVSGGRTIGWIFRIVFVVRATRG